MLFSNRINYSLDLSSNLNPCTVRRLRTACERANHTLFCYLKIHRNRLSEGIDFSTSLTCARFEDLCQDLFYSRSRGPPGLQDRQSNVHEIVSISGSSLILGIIKFVSDFFHGKVPNKSINSEVVAYGSAVQTAILSCGEDSGSSS